MKIIVAFQAGSRSLRTCSIDIVRGPG